jgi:hypothetical protein
MKKTVSHLLLGLSAISALCITTPAFAWTFVGNGGSSGEIETIITFKQIEDTFHALPASRVDACSCNPQFQNHSMCETLKSMNEEQHAYCADHLKAIASEMADLAHNRDEIRIAWTQEKIEVIDNGQHRAADAVADPANHQITINQERFLQMQPYERFFLLTHELMHFTKADDKLLTDEGPLGPFAGPSGARNYIDASAAASVMRAEDDGIFKKYRGTLSRAQGWKRRWFDIDLGSDGYTGGSTTFTMPNFGMIGTSFRYYPWDTFGFVVGYEGGSATKGILTTITATENINVFYTGPSYRWFPFKNPISYWGQSHLVVNLLVEYLTSHYNANDGDVSIDYSTNTWGVGATCTYYIPIWKFWGHLGGGIHSRPYEYADLNVNYDKPFISAHAGVSYGF